MSNILIVLATVVIAIFSALTWFASRRIHQSTQKKDKEIKIILKHLTAATLVGGRGVGYEKTMLNTFKEMLKELDALEKK